MAFDSENYRLVLNREKNQATVFAFVIVIRDGKTR